MLSVLFFQSLDFFQGLLIFYICLMMKEQLVKASLNLNQTGINKSNYDAIYQYHAFIIFEIGLLPTVDSLLMHDVH